MKYSNAAILGFMGCALALPTPAQDESQGLPNLPFPLPSGLLHPSGGLPNLPIPTGGSGESGEPGGLPFPLPSGLPDISKLLPTGLPIKRDGISDLLNPSGSSESGGSGGSGATGTSSGSGGLPFPIPSGISDLLHPSGQAGSSGSSSGSSGSGGLPFPLPSGLPDISKLLPTGLPIKREEGSGLPFPIPSGISDLLHPSGQAGSSSGSGGSGGLPFPLPSGLPDISKLLPTDLPIKREEESALPLHFGGLPNLPEFPKPTGGLPELPKPVGDQLPGFPPAPTPTSAAIPTGSAVAFKA